MFETNSDEVKLEVKAPAGTVQEYVKPVAVPVMLGNIATVGLVAQSKVKSGDVCRAGGARSVATLYVAV